MLSGVGPSSHLSSVGLKTLVDNPTVGQHLADHPRVSNQFGIAAEEDDLYDAIARNSTLFDELLAEWETEKQGVMANGGSNHIGWLRIPDDDPVWETEEDPSAGPTSPHYEFLFRVSPCSSGPSPGSHLMLELAAWIYIDGDRDTCPINRILHDHFSGRRLAVVEWFRHPLVRVSVRLPGYRPRVPQHPVRRLRDACGDSLCDTVRLCQHVGRFPHWASCVLRECQPELRRCGGCVGTLSSVYDMASYGDSQDGGLRRHGQRRRS